MHILSRRNKYFNYFNFKTKKKEYNLIRCFNLNKNIKSELTKVKKRNRRIKKKKKEKLLFTFRWQ